MYASNEKIAHDLAVAIVTRIADRCDPDEIAYEYDNYYADILNSLNNMSLGKLVEKGIIHP